MRWCTETLVRTDDPDPGVDKGTAKGFWGADAAEGG